MASDVFRGYVGLSVGIALSAVVPFVYVGAPGIVHVPTMVTATYLICWSLAAFTTSALTVLTFRGATGEQLSRWLTATTPRSGTLRFWYAFNGGGAASWAITGSFIAIAAVLLLSFNAELRGDPVLITAGVAVVASSLLMTITAYAVRYAREHANVGGLSFPETPSPTYADFFYLAAQVGTTFSSSDVTIESTRMRRLITTNSLISFTYNTVIVALLVSLLVASAS
jgi:uncharacterized membrane protein